MDAVIAQPTLYQTPLRHIALHTINQHKYLALVLIKFAQQTINVLTVHQILLQTLLVPSVLVHMFHQHVTLTRLFLMEDVLTVHQTLNQTLWGPNASLFLSQLLWPATRTRSVQITNVLTAPLISIQILLRHIALHRPKLYHATTTKSPHPTVDAVIAQLILYQTLPGLNVSLITNQLL